MFRYALTLAAAVGATLFWLQACSPGDASAAAEGEQKQAATAQAAKPAEKPKDKLSRIDKSPEQLAASPVVAAARADTPTKPAAAPSPAEAAANAALIAAGDKQYRAGKDYIVLSPAKRTSSPPEKVELTEVFMYQCPHCYSFEPFIESVLSNPNERMNFVRLPAIFNKVAKLHAQAFYAAQSMGVWEKLHTPFFREIHTNRNLMPDEDKLLSFVASQGIDRDMFRKVMKSFEVDSRVRDAMDLNQAYQISSVPTLVVNGKYVTSGSMAKSNERLRGIVDYLMAKEAAAL